MPFEILQWCSVPIFLLCCVDRLNPRGISYGAGLLIREARSGAISPRQIFLSCVFMGFAHSVFEDTIVMISLGADIYSVLVGRLVFAVVATAAIAVLLRCLSDNLFFARLFRVQDL